MEKIILASQSPRRKQLLEWAEINFEVMVSDTDESFPGDMNVKDIPVFIARNKALNISERAGSSRVIVAADTIVVLNNRVIGKPADRNEAIATLQQLSGKRHEVITGVVLSKNKD